MNAQPPPRHITQAATPIVCHACEAVIAWRFPSGYIRFEDDGVREFKRESDGRIAVLCGSCGRRIRLAA